MTQGQAAEVDVMTATVEGSPAPHQALAGADGDCLDLGRGDGGRESHRQSSFFRFEEDLLHDPDWRDGLSLGALLVLLCHLKGYVGSRHYSGMGMKGIRERTGLRPRDVRVATRELVKVGLILELPVTSAKYPKTCIASVRSPFAPGTVATNSAIGHDGHHYETHQAAGVDSVVVPWSLVDPSPDMSEPTIADIETKEALLFLLWLYLECRDDGYVHKRAAHARYETGEAEGSGRVQFVVDDEKMRRLGWNITFKLYLKELVRVGLVQVGAEGRDGSYPLVLTHRRSDAQQRDEQAA